MRSEQVKETTNGSILRAIDIRKSFFGVHALRGVDIDLRAREVHALVGHNGSGKSTLCKILAGLYTRDGGSLQMNGTDIAISGPHDARHHGISLIPQEPLLVPLLSAPANIFLGREREFRRGGLIRTSHMKKRAATALAELDYECNLDAPVASLSMAAQEMIAIARALVWDARVLILDEPTASLSRHEVDVLFRTMERLRRAGVSQVFISHRLEEIGEIADRVTLLVDGLVRASGPACELPPARLAELMVPERPEARSRRGIEVPQMASQAGETALAVENLSVGKKVTDVSLSVRVGEVVGITGQVGSGKTETLHGIIGLDRPSSGRVFLFGRPARLRSPADAVRAGVGFLPEDRSQSLVPLLPAADNMLLSDLNRVSRLGFLDGDERRRASEDLRARFDIATPAHLFRAVRNLSGGNQQKVGVARWVFRGSRVLIFDEPTRGIDIGTKARVHDLIRGLAAAGKAVLVSSSDYEEIVGICDRVMVFKQGRVAAELSGEHLTEQEIVACAL